MTLTRTRAGRGPRKPSDSDALARALSQLGDVEARSDSATLGMFSTDASNYRVVPRVVAAPRSTDALKKIVSFALSEGIPLTARGAGTSCAGNAIGPGIVLDTVRHLNRILRLDAEARTAEVEPGVVMAALQRAAARHGLRFGPDPSTHTRCTIGGMIGNNACGPHAVAYGRTSDNVLALDMIDGTARSFTAESDLSIIGGLPQFADSNLALIRTEFGRFGRQVSGYSLEHLAPENGHSLVRALVGTEGTCGIVLGATVRLVEQATAPVLVVLGYPDMPSAADAVPALLAHRPLAIEGMDARLVDVVRRVQGADAVPPLPAGGGWLMVEVGGESLGEALDAARTLVADAGTQAVKIMPPGPEASAAWRIRADGAGLAGRTPSNAQAWPGWEDAAVPPEVLGSYLREFEALMAAHHVDGLPYGHFGDGCVHVRLDIPLDRDGRALRAFMEDAADLVTAHGGSLSGEHGDGRARSELLDRMYSPGALAALRQFKGLFDPCNLMNPGVLVDSDPLDSNLRRPQAHRIRRSDGFAFTEDAGDFTAAVHRCTGVAKCRADNSGAGGFMCPSFQASGEEKDVTRGRARVLQEMANGSLIREGWASSEVAEVLDLCLACKACSSDCPAGVDMARYKSEVLFRRFRRRLRPVNHYVLGWLPRWTRLAAAAPRLANAVLHSPLRSIILGVSGMDTRRSLPRFATRSFSRAHRGQQAAKPWPGSGGLATGAAPPRRVLLWTDSFSDTLAPEIPEAIVEVLANAGYEVMIAPSDACCGLTWITTGQLQGAKKHLSHLLDRLAPFAINGIPILGVEPSCTAVLRSDLLDLLPEDPRSSAVAENTVTLAELLNRADWRPPPLEGITVVAQPHCHQHSVMGYRADIALLERAGARVTALAGCCGMAGNFGMERGHYETSVAVAENQLLPALRDAPEGPVFLADGFSCRTQAEDLAGVQGLHLAQLLAQRL